MTDTTSAPQWEPGAAARLPLIDRLWKPALGILAALALGWFGAMAAHWSAIPAEPVGAALDAVTVRIDVGGGSGSGVVIGDGTLVLTAAHVARDAENVKVEASDGRMLDATVLWVGESSDLALLRIDYGQDRARLPAAELRCEGPQTGDAIEIVGAPVAGGSSLLLPWTHTYGRVSNQAFEDPDGGTFILTDAGAYFGNSGGPAFNTDGEVIGIVVAIIGIKSMGRPAPQGITLIVPAAQVCEMLGGGV